MAEERKYKKPLPRLDQENRPFWEACARHELYVQKCKSCGTLRYYTRVLCPTCLSDQTEWVKSNGKGKVYTFTVTYQNQSAGFRENLPYIMAYVELDEGIRMLTNIVGCKPEEVKIGMPVEVTFEDATPEISVPLFRPTA